MSDQEDFPRHMSATDAQTWRLERDPVLRSTITLVMLLDRAPDMDRLRDKAEQASRFFPRLRERVVEMPMNLSTPVWSPDPHFDLAYHVRQFKAPGDGSVRALLDATTAIAMQAFDTARPLWEQYVIDGLEDGRAALILKAHHSLTDGVGGVMLVGRLFDFEREPAPSDEAVPSAPEGEHVSTGALIVEGLTYELGHQTTRLRDAVIRTIGRARNPVGSTRDTITDARALWHALAPNQSPRSPIMLNRSPRYHLDSFTVSLSELKAASHKANGHLNDAYLSGVAGALARYHAAHDTSAPELHIAMPVNLRTEDAATGGNQWALGNFELPTDIDDVGDRMGRIGELVEEQRELPMMQNIDALYELTNLVPTALVVDLGGDMMKVIDVLATNVPGVPVPIFSAGAEVVSMLAFAPTSGAAVTFTLLSYKDAATIGITADPEAVTDPETLRECAVEAFDEVLKYGAG